MSLLSPIHIRSLKAFRYAIILFSPRLPLCLPLRMGCKYTIPYVRGQRDERMMEGRAGYFPPALKAAMTHVQESCTFAKRFFMRCLQTA